MDFYNMVMNILWALGWPAQTSGFVLLPILGIAGVSYATIHYVALKRVETDEDDESSYDVYVKK